MSGSRLPFQQDDDFDRSPFQQDEPVRVRQSPALRAPSPKVLEESLRRHCDGDATPLRSDGDPGWTSRVGQQVWDKGISEGLPDNRTIDRPREALKEALANRDTLSAEAHRLGQMLKAAELHSRNMAEEADAAAASDRAAWSRWADGPRDQPAPANSLEKRAKLDALALSAQAKVIALREPCAAAQAKHPEGARPAEQAVAEALAAVVLEIGDELRNRSYQLSVEQAQLRAQLLGLAQYFKSAGNGTAAGQLLSMRQIEQRRVDMLPELQAMEREATQFPKTLMRDPDAKLGG